MGASYSTALPLRDVAHAAIAPQHVGAVAIMFPNAIHHAASGAIAQIDKLKQRFERQAIK